MFLSFPITSKAVTMKYADVPNGSYIIGQHIYTIEESGSLTVKEIMYAAQTIGSFDMDDMKIIYKTMSGKYVDESSPSSDVLTISEDDTFEYTWMDNVLNVSDVIEYNEEKLVEKYYNNYPSQELDIENENFDAEIFYTPVGIYIGGEENPQELKINGTAYDKENKKLSIGKNGQIVAPVWKIEDDIVYVATPWLIAEALPGSENIIEVGGIDLSVVLFGGIDTDNKLTIKEAKAFNEVSGHTNDVSYDGTVITNKSSHGNHILEIVLEYDGETIYDSNELIYRLASDGSMGITTPETINGKKLSYATYMNYAVGAHQESLQWEVSYKLGIVGKGSVSVNIDYQQIAVLNDVIEAKADELNNTYYEKFNSETITVDSSSFNADIFYIKVGKYNGTLNPIELKINNATYNKQVKSLSIGMNSQINAPVWKVEGGNLYVATTWLIAETQGMDAVISVGGVKYNIRVFSKAQEDEALTISKVFPLFTVDGYTNDLELDGDTVTQTSSHGLHAFGIVLKAGEEEILDSSNIIYRLSSNQNMGLTTPETLDGKKITYGTYMNYANSAYTETKELNYSYKLAIKGIGVTTFNIEYNQIVEE